MRPFALALLLAVTLTIAGCSSVPNPYEREQNDAPHIPYG